MQMQIICVDLFSLAQNDHECAVAVFAASPASTEGVRAAAAAHQRCARLCEGWGCSKHARSFTFNYKSTLMCKVLLPFNMNILLPPPHPLQIEKNEIERS